MSNIKTCPTCQAQFLNGEHFWATGKKGNPLDLAGLVCNKFCKGRPCINPCKGEEGGDTWEDRMGRLEVLESEYMTKDGWIV